ncbi:polysaccharide biosynthesis protein [Chitinophaga parva]|uniref:Polysaccharide biosynthesis protein n=1 Tax=Chitinophaga parva TaxID=2169414 RepID=A0A2T7BHK3_9BACT|nr:polysaccharide biosynthesis C-terminal domain-containing protein [Chitinophaga parva]PUZ25723.1 polysaccharide biosynthesis protein [Chitinophaga parva]
MGIIRKQSITSTLFIYIGFAIGAINTLLFTGKYFTEAQYGLTRELFDLSTTFFALSNLGGISILYRFYPYYRDRLPLQERDLFTKMLMLSLSGYIVIGILAYVFQGFIGQYFIVNSPLLVHYLYTVYPMTLFYLLFSMLEAQAWNHFSSIAANFFKELGLRLLTTVLIALYIFKWIDFNQFIIAYSFLYGIIFLGLLFYLYRKGQISLTFKTSKITRRMYKKMMPFASFVFFASLFTMLARNFDGFIISSVLSLTQTGIFNFANYLTSLMEGPQRGLVSVSVVVIAQAWKDKDMERIASIYRKTALNMLLFAGFLFGLVLLNLHAAFEVFHIKASFLQGEMVLVFLGLTKMVELGTGVNAQIIATSRYWRVDFISTVSLLLMLIPLNYILIRHFGITGSAMATLIAYFFFNLVRYIFIWVKFDMQPFTWRNGAVLVILAVNFFIVRLLVDVSNPLLDIACKSALFTGLNAAVLLSLHISEDANKLWSMGLEKVKAIISRS